MILEILADFPHRVWPDGRRVGETGFGKKPVGLLWARSQPSEGEAGFLPSGLTRWHLDCRDGIRWEARRPTLSSVSTERGRSWFSSIGFDTMAVGLSRRDSVRSLSAYSELGLNRARAKLILCHRVWLDGRRVGRCADDKKGDGRVRRYGDVCKLADGTLCLPKQEVCPALY